MPNGPKRALPMPRARLGRWSVVVAIIALLLLAAGAVGLVMAGNEQANAPPPVAVLATVAALWLSRLFNLIGVVLGVIGLARRERLPGAAGLLLNIAMIFGGDWLAGRFALLFAGS